MNETHERIEDAWWCDEHREVHSGPIDSFSMGHRVHLHPVFAHIRTDR